MDAMLDREIGLAPGYRVREPAPPAVRVPVVIAENPTLGPPVIRLPERGRCPARRLLPVASDQQYEGDGESEDDDEVGELGGHLAIGIDRLGGVGRWVGCGSVAASSGPLLGSRIARLGS